MHSKPVKIIFRWSGYNQYTWSVLMGLIMDRLDNKKFIIKVAETFEDICSEAKSSNTINVLAYSFCTPRFKEVAEEIREVKTLFGNNPEHKPSSTLITTGILARVRNPMYLGIFLIYVAMLLLLFSFIALIIAVVAFLVYNKMVNFEEGELEKLFGQEWLDYKKKIPKWIPKLRK